MLRLFICVLLLQLLCLKTCLAEYERPLAWCPSLTHIRCEDGLTCIRKSWMCDGNIDCPDHSDEPSHICLKRPQNNYLQLKSIHSSLKCPPSWFRCTDSSHCIAPTSVCDGQKDCRDGSDEKEFCYVLNHQLIRPTNSPIIY